MQPPIPQDSHVMLTSLFITSVFGFVTTVVVQLLGIYKENKEREWDREDRRAASQMTVQKIDANTELTATTLQTAQAVDQIVRKLPGAPTEERKPQVYDQRQPR